MANWMAAAGQIAAGLAPTIGKLAGEFIVTPEEKQEYELAKRQQQVELAQAEAQAQQQKALQQTLLVGGGIVAVGFFAYWIINKRGVGYG